MRLTLFCAALGLCVIVPTRAQSPVEPADLTAVRAVPNGLVTVNALDLPESFLNHVILWELRGAWREANHRVQAPLSNSSNATNATNPSASASEAGPAPSSPGDSFTIMPPEALGVDHATLDAWLTIPFEVPELRGFCAPIGAHVEDPYPFALLQRDPDDEVAHRYRTAATFVSQHLAYDGLVRTVVRLMSELQPPAPWIDSDGRVKMTRLRAVGVPVDLLAMYTIESASADQFLSKWAVNGSPRDLADSLAPSARLNFLPTSPGFRALAEDGSESVRVLRMQLPTNRFREALGDGSVLDVFRQIALADPSLSIIVTIHADAVRDLVQEMSTWNVPSPQRIVIVPQPANVTQWAHDNGKAGVIISESGQTKPAMLVPRYASRTELRTVCVPSDSLATDVLGRSMMNVHASPLLFQGGNLMVIDHPRSGKRLLLVGEAEVHRNRALGLSEFDVLNAFAEEFGVDECVVIPPASFHIDLDFTIRRCGDQLVACVIDETPASRLILADGIRALARATILPQTQVEPLISATAQNGPSTAPAIASIANALSKLRGDDGQYNAALAAAFTAPGGDDPPLLRADAARRFLLAMDIIMADALTDAQMAGMAPPLRRYLQSLRAQAAATDRIADRLAKLDMRVHRIPGFSDHEVSVNPINGLHLGKRYFMPSFGGVYASLDQSAMTAFQNAFGPDVQIQPIRTAAVQSTDGGLHCMIGLHPN